MGKMAGRNKDRGIEKEAGNRWKGGFIKRGIDRMAGRDKNGRKGTDG